MKKNHPAKSRPAQHGFVYVFVNPGFPEWVKIGRASDWAKRLGDFQTYVPDDYVVYATLKTSDMAKVERLVHELVGFNRRQKKEFFCVSPETATNCLRRVAETIGEIGGLTLYEDGAPSVVFGLDGKPKSCRDGSRLRGVRFRAAKNGVAIFMTFRGGEYVVLAGSELCPMTPSLRTSESRPIASLRETRESIENDPTRCGVRGDGRKILLVDVPFKSSSRALAVMLGYSAVQGPKYWVDNDGVPLAEYL